MEYVSKSEEETLKIAGEFTKQICREDAHLGRSTLVGLYGELGTGKTTFMKGVAKYFGINETIQSPTFVIEKIYELPVASSQQPAAKFTHLIHIDAYRIEKSDEMINLGWKEIISDPQNLIFIEWPERLEDIMLPHTKIFFSHVQTEHERKIIIIKLK